MRAVFEGSDRSPLTLLIAALVFIDIRRTQGPAHSSCQVTRYHATQNVMYVQWLMIVTT